MKYLRRLIYRTKDEPLNPLYHVFFWITLLAGISFVFFPVASHAIESVLFRQTLIILPDFIASAWGIWLLALTAANTIMLMFRPKFLAEVVGLGGSMAWLYAAIIFILSGYWFGLLTFALPNLAFWIYYYFKISEYYRYNYSDI